MNRLVSLCLLASCALCASCRSEARPPTTRGDAPRVTPLDQRPAPASASAPTPAPAPAPREVVFHGACDASGTVPLTESRFVAADDEDNVLRVYDADAGGPPIAQHDISAALGVPLKGKKRPRPAEMDLEAATRIGDRAYWLTSHGRNKKGKAQPARLRFFATVAREDAAFDVIGHGYERLIDDLAADPRLAKYDLAGAATKPPKADGGLAIEGLTAAPEGHLMLAFRNPIPGGRALIVPLFDAARLVDKPGAAPARFGDPVLLDLGGRGVRSLSWWRGRYLIVAGSHGDGGTSVLYTWDGRGDARQVTAVDLSAYNPEGFFTPEERDQIMVVSDDGEREIDGERCKKLDDPARKRFRGVWITLPEAP